MRRLEMREDRRDVRLESKLLKQVSSRREASSSKASSCFSISRCSSSSWLSRTTFYLSLSISVRHGIGPDAGTGSAFRSYLSPVTRYPHLTGWGFFRSSSSISVPSFDQPSFPGSLLFTLMFPRFSSVVCSRFLVLAFTWLLLFQERGARGSEAFGPIRSRTLRPASCPPQRRRHPDRRRSPPRRDPSTPGPP